MNANEFLEMTQAERDTYVDNTRADLHKLAEWLREEEARKQMRRNSRAVAVKVAARLIGAYLALVLLVAVLLGIAAATGLI